MFFFPWEGMVRMKYTVDRAEVRRYMGLRGHTEDTAVERLIDKAIEIVQAAAVPKHVCREASFSLQSDAVLFSNQTVRSSSLRAYLDNCSQAVAFAATLGSEVDRIITKDSILHPALAVAEQAAATSLLESYSDACCLKLELPFLARGLHFKPRFSPGYADCPLDSQELLLAYLDAYKRIGLTLTDHCMMTPIKSISAWIGVSDEESSCTGHGCAMCSKTNCDFRNEEISNE